MTHCHRSDVPIEPDLPSNRLEAILRQLPCGVVLAEAEGGSIRIVFSNDQVYRIWRRPRESGEAEHSAAFPLYHLDGRPFGPEEWPLERALRGEQVVDVEMAIVRGDGTRGVISVSSTPVRDPDGSVVAAVAVFDDVTEQWQRESEHMFLVEAARLLSSSLDYHVTLASLARLAVPRIADWCAVDVWVDGAVERLAIVHPDPEREAIAREIWMRWPPPADSPVREVLRTGKPMVYPEVSEEMLRQSAVDEEHLDALLQLGMRSAMLVPMVARGRTVGTISFVSAESGRRYGPTELRVAEKLASRAGMAVDNALLYEESIRTREEAEQARRAAEAANRAKSEFLASMSHEIRTPLNAVMGYTELLELGLGGPLTDIQRGHLSRISRSTGHLLALVEDLLDLARIESGRLEVNHESERVTVTAEAVLAMVGPQAEQRGVRLENHCVDADILYYGDSDRVRQILLNIVGNAIKFTPEGGSVTISCGGSDQGPPVPFADPGPWTCIRVEDTGLGIAPDQVERIFRPFEQVESGLTRQMGGAGLGLAISRQLALLMGGEITVASEVGRGSTFTLWLPREAPADVTTLGQEGEKHEAEGLAATAGLLLYSIGGILDEYARMLRGDALTSVAAPLEESQVKDHHSSLLSDIAATLLAIGEAHPTQARLLRDGSEIQRLIAELHGRQRAALGWTEESLHREFELLRQVVENRLRRAAAGKSIHAESALEVVRQLLDRVHRISSRVLRSTLTATSARGPQS